MKKIAILQSNYLPWKGVFDIINSVDIFVFLEDVQYTERDWRNRNLIQTRNGVKWISVPIKNSGRRGQLIFEAEIDFESDWQKKHFLSFQVNYASAPFFKQYKWIIEELYHANQWKKISDFNIYSTKLIANVLGIRTQFINSADLNTSGSKDDKLIEICNKLDGNFYLSGPAARNYIIPDKFSKNNISLDYFKYEYPRYKQLYEPFDHHLTILDLLFNCGPDAPYYIWGWRENKHKGVVEYDIL